jgi:hypothetical protein
VHVRDTSLSYLDAEHSMDAFFPHFDRGGCGSHVQIQAITTHDLPLLNPSHQAQQASATPDEWGSRIPPANSILKQGATMPVDGQEIATSIRLVGDADVFMFQEVILRYFHSFLYD